MSEAPETKKPDLATLKSADPVISDLDIKVALDRTYLTYREHCLAGIQTCGQYYEKNPDKPVGVIDGQLRVEEAAQQRREKGRIAAQGRYFNLPGTIVQISLEDLTVEGVAKQLPRILNENLEPITTAYSGDFPCGNYIR